MWNWSAYNWGGGRKENIYSVVSPQEKAIRAKWLSDRAQQTLWTQHARRYTQLLKSKRNGLTLVDIKRRVAATKCCSHRWIPAKAGANSTQRASGRSNCREHTFWHFSCTCEGTSDGCGNLSQYTKYGVTHLLTTVSHMMHFPSRTISRLGTPSYKK